MRSPRKRYSSISSTLEQHDDWRAIAEKASQEPDPKKVVKLVEDLCQKLEEREAQRKGSDTAGC